MSVAAPSAETPNLTRRHILLLITGLLLAQLVASIEGTVVSTAAPTIVADLGGLSQISWVFTGYLLTSTATTPLWGKLSDLFGRRRLYELSIVIFMVGSVLCGAVHDDGDAHRRTPSAGRRRGRHLHVDDDDHGRCPVAS